MTTGELTGKTVAVVGGDRRMLEIMRQARAAGATVKTYGGAPGADVAADRPPAASLAEAVKGAHLIVGPIPGLAADDALYAPFASDKLYLTGDVLGGARPGALLVFGRASAGIMKNAEGKVRAIGFGDDDALAILHAVPTAEGALKVAIEHTETTILGLSTLCIGMGRVGMSVAQIFKAVDADVTLCARNPSQLARAWAMGLRTMHLNDLRDRIGEFPLVVSSASGLVLTREILERTTPDALIIDLCSPPGSVDFPAGEALKRKVIWARGQAGTAPTTSGYNEWQVIMRIVREESLPA